MSEPKRTLLTIDADLDALAQGFDHLESEGQDAAGLLLDSFGEVLEERNGKIDRWVGYIRAKYAASEVLKAEAKQYKAEADRLGKLAKTLESEADKSRDWLKQIFIRLGWQRMETSLNRIYVRSSGKRPLILARPEVELVDKSPEFYLVIDKKLDREQIAKDLLLPVDEQSEWLRENFRLGDESTTLML